MEKITSLLVYMLVIATLLQFSSFAVKAKSTPLDGDIEITIGAGMFRGTIAGISIARKIGIGTNVRVVNNGIEALNGSWELIYTSFSGEFITNRKGNFTTSPDDVIPYHKCVIIYTTFLHKINRITMTVTVGNYTVSRSGMRIGPLVILGRYCK